MGLGIEIESAQPLPQKLRGWNPKAGVRSRDHDLFGILQPLAVWRSTLERILDGTGHFNFLWRGDRRSRSSWTVHTFLVLT